MHPFQNINLADSHVSDMQATASRHRLARQARRSRRGARSPAPTTLPLPIPLRPIAEPDERRPAA
jgi:hypothetical protein